MNRVNAGGYGTKPQNAVETGPVPRQSFLAAPDDRILVTGGAGFIGSRVVEQLIERGYRNLICFVRPSSELSRIVQIIDQAPPGVRIDVMKGNLLARADCEAACEGVAVIYHLAAGTGEKSFPDAFMNSVVATRNLLDASLRFSRLRRLVLVSSFTVYSNCDKPRGRLLDESCPLEQRPELRGDAYCFAKVKQENLVVEYGKNFGIPYVVVRPGSVYGGGKLQITGRVGLGTFGLFLHLGGSNIIPFTYVDNCAQAIVLAGLVEGVDGEAFNIVDDDLPLSRHFLHLYKKNVRPFKSVYVPHSISYALCLLWEKYAQHSKGQLPAAFNRRRWHMEWKKTQYSNHKLKVLLGWAPPVPTTEAMRRYFQSCKESGQHA
ncbi:MAG TPA: NAD(P)-dependent oxidoreductase [Bryobacteraceae bacterium]|jgi:nucleoside-diphosphate-sugar epimerase|nr:NAD(P)-dependent oxidoreductase [Bryobacteraceae bacterium]